MVDLTGMLMLYPIDENDWCHYVEKLLLILYLCNMSRVKMR